MLSDANERAITLVVQDLREEMGRVQSQEAFGTLEISVGFEEGRAGGDAIVTFKKRYRLTSKARK